MASKKQRKQSFENSLEELESIVNRMEEENLPLEALLTSYENGQELLSHCQDLIQDARQRIEVVHLKNQRSKEGAENKLASEPSTGDNPTSEASSDDIRLL